MRLQKNTRLALYSVLELAARPGQFVSAIEVAERYGESAHHLAKVMSDLARAGLVDSVRGVGGGYRFAGNARRLTLLDVIRLFEDLGPEAPAPVGVGTPVHQALAGVLSEIDQIAQATFGSVTIATMLKMVERAAAARR